MVLNSYKYNKKRPVKFTGLIHKGD